MHDERTRRRRRLQIGGLVRARRARRASDAAQSWTSRTSRFPPHHHNIVSRRRGARAPFWHHYFSARRGVESSKGGAGSKLVQARHPLALIPTLILRLPAIVLLISASPLSARLSLRSERFLNMPSSHAPAEADGASSDEEQRPSKRSKSNTALSSTSDHQKGAPPKHVAQDVTALALNGGSSSSLVATPLCSAFGYFTPAKPPVAHSSWIGSSSDLRPPRDTPPSSARARQWKM